MKKRNIIYLFITIIFVALSTIILHKTDMSNNVLISKSVQIILILALIRISIGCTFYIKEQYDRRKYSYSIIMNLGLLLFIIINILRQINLLMQNWDVINIIQIYNNTLKSFSFFAMLILPCIIVLALYSIVTNIILINNEEFGFKNLLGIVLGVLALIGLLGCQTLYYFITNLLIGTDRQFIKYMIDICVNATLSYFYTLIIATLYCNIRVANHVPTFDKDFIIILGSRINSDGSLTPLLKGRVDKATNTIENLKYSKNKIDEINSDGNIVFSTTNYHVFRSGVIANNQGIDCEGIGSKTKWYFYTNALIREFVANIVQEKRSHFILILTINMFLIILFLIGRYYNFLNIIN